MKTFTLCLGFDKDAEEAVTTYVKLFDAVFGNSKILHTSYFTEKEVEAARKVPGMTDDILPGPAGSAKVIRFTLNGQDLLAFNGNAYFGKFTESASLYITCETQEQIDTLWATLSQGGKTQTCGWVTDKFGVSWQIVPPLVREITEGSDQAKAERLNVELFNMEKIDIQQLQKVCEA